MRLLFNPGGPEDSYSSQRYNISHLPQNSTYLKTEEIGFASL